MNTSLVVLENAMKSIKKIYSQLNDMNDYSKEIMECVAIFFEKVHDANYGIAKTSVDFNEAYEQYYKDFKKIDGQINSLYESLVDAQNKVNQGLDNYNNYISISPVSKKNPFSEFINPKKESTPKNDSEKSQNKTPEKEVQEKSEDKTNYQDIEKVAAEMKKILSRDLGKTKSELGYSGAWCAQYAWDTINSITNKFDNYSSASTGYSMGYFLNKKNGTSFHYDSNNSLYTDKKEPNGNSYVPKPGDFIFFDWDGQRWNGDASPSGNQDHTGLVIDYDPATGTITTLEGNIRVSGSSTEVYSRKISISSNCIIGFGSWY